VACIRARGADGAVDEVATLRSVVVLVTSEEHVAQTRHGGHPGFGLSPPARASGQPAALCARPRRRTWPLAVTLLVWLRLAVAVGLNARRARPRLPFPVWP